MDPIATYHERQIRSGWDRQFDLYEARIIIRASKTLGSEWEESINLSTLDPTPSRMHIRPPWMKTGLTTFLIGGTFAFMSHAAAERGQLPAMTIAALGLAVLGLILLALGFPKVTFVRFRPTSGAGISLDIALAGRERDQFMSFVQSVCRRIQASQPASSPAADSTPVRLLRSCLKCGYDLRGNVSGTCPECGCEIW